MFSLPYLYYYLAASFFSFMLRRSATRSEGSGQKSGSALDYLVSTYRSQESFVYRNSEFLKFLGSVCAIASLFFLILGFWYMPEWWYPLVFFGISILATTFIPMSDNAGGILGMILAPIACVLMYLSLFGVI